MCPENNFQKNKDDLLKLLLPQTSLELIFDVDLINNNIDVRNCIVYEATSDTIVISQPNPPLMKSTISSSLEATFLYRDPVTSEVIRWGWHCQIEKFVSNYFVDEDSTTPVTAVVLSSPSPDSIIATNARLDYRLRSTEEKKVHIQTHPSFGKVSLLDFSAGGVLIAIPQPAQIPVGKRMWITLVFPLPIASNADEVAKESTISGEVEVVRITILEGVAMAQVALKFVDLDLASNRTLQKAVNFYMIEEQRDSGEKGVAHLVSSKGAF